MRQKQYSNTDRFLHKFLLGSREIQRISFSIQRILEPHSVKPDRPVFITGMPRSGTTMLLNLIFATRQFESSRYRDLPFPLCPALSRRLNKFSSPKKSESERAHGDGIMISKDSPEAFEEIFWRNIGDHNPENDAIKYFSDYIASIASSSLKRTRYISKNNNNISRLSLFTKICQHLNGIVLVPIRNPIKVADSSRRMHLKFLALQEEDNFVLDYMNLLGHQEFGRGHQWLQLGERQFKSDSAPVELESWLQYWIYVHSHILQNTSANLFLVDFDTLRSNPESGYKLLSSICKNNDYDKKIVDMLCSEGKQNQNAEQILDNNLAKTAFDLYRELLSHSK
jgi:Sulfotransferase family